MPLFSAFALLAALPTGIGPLPQPQADAPIAILRPAAPPDRPLPGLMLEPGLFHGDEVPNPATLPTQGWLALVMDAEGMRLSPAQVGARASFDPIRDAGPSQQSGVDVGATLADGGAAEALLLLHGLPLQAGPVSGIWPAHALLSAGSRWDLPGGPLGTRLVVTDGDGMTDPDRIDPHSGIRIALHRKDPAGGLRVQELAQLAQADPDGGPYLLWAGDLDGDGETDLLLELDVEGNRSRTQLLLSRLAAPGDLVAPAAQLDTTGC